VRPANGEIKRRKLMILPELGPIDARSRTAGLFREIAAALANDLGGKDALSKAQIELLRRASGLGVLADRIEHKLVTDKPIDPAEYVNIAAAQSRILRSLGLKRVPRDVTLRLEDQEAGLV
jgi:hypothetical protein